MAETDARQVSGREPRGQGAGDPRVTGSSGISRLTRSVTNGWPVLVAVALAACVLAYLQKVPCRAGGWNIENFQYTHACYSDVYPLYYVEGLADGKLPYLGHAVEYPVVIGAFMQVVAWIVGPVADPTARGLAFYDITAACMAACAVVAVLATAYVARRDGRRKFSRDGLLIACSPGLILAAYINWDLLAVALTAVAIACWGRRRLVWAGVLLGLAIATKFYPLLLLGPLLLLCLRAGKLRAFAITTGAAVATWAVVNVPVALAAPHGWATFYTFSQERPADWGSIWYFFQTAGVPFLGTENVSRINTMGTGAFVVCCALIAVLALTARRRPRLGQLCFLVLAAFLITNKVWSPQYVLWLLPFLVLARPRILSYVVWQIVEIGYFIAVWPYLLRVLVQSPGLGIGGGPYFTALVARSVVVLALCALVVVDVLRPSGDIVRRDGVDDPAGGVLDGADDRFVLRPRPPATPEPA
jgi:uncharacterized membrane protein